MELSCSLGNLFTVKKFFLCVYKGSFLYFILCQLPLVLSLGAIENSLAMSSLHPAIRYLHTLIRYSLSLLISMVKMSQLSQPCFIMLDAPVPYTSLWALAPVCRCISCAGEPRTGHSTPDVSHQWQTEEKDHLHWPAGSVLPNAAQYVVGFLCCEGTLLADLQFLAQWGPLIFFCKADFQPVIPQPVLVHEYNFSFTNSADYSQVTFLCFMCWKWFPGR